MYSPFRGLSWPFVDKTGLFISNRIFQQFHINSDSFPTTVFGAEGGGGTRTRYDLPTTELCVVVVFLKLQDACTISVAWFETWRSWRHVKNPVILGEAIIMVARDDVCSDPNEGAFLETQNPRDIQPTGVTSNQQELKNGKTENTCAFSLRSTKKKTSDLVVTDSYLDLPFVCKMCAENHQPKTLPKGSNFYISRRTFRYGSYSLRMWGFLHFRYLKLLRTKETLH